MPAHIYIRMGQYSDAVTVNQLAIKADKEYIRHHRAQGFYPGAYYPHNMHFLWWALLWMVEPKTPACGQPGRGLCQR